MELTVEQKTALLKDFTGWSGGLTPDEFPANKVCYYVDNVMTVDVDRVKAIVFLVTYHS